MSGEHVVEIKTEKADTLVPYIKKRMEDISSLKVIFRVMNNQNDKSYEPNKISIGPFHYGNPKLNQMEDHKWRYLAALLNRKPNLEESLESCVKALRECEHRVRNCYGEPIHLSSDVFIQTILLDSCFLIELFLKFSIKGLRRRNDVVFTTPGFLFDLRRDMVLLENQIPLFVIQQIFHLVPIPPQCTMSFNELASKFFKNIIPGDSEFLKEKFNQEGHHLLDLVRRCIVPIHSKVVPKDDRDDDQHSNPNSHLDYARKLKKCGIRFKKGKYNSLLLEVKFEHGAILIPHLRIHECIEELLKNLIALESHLDDTQQTTSYAFFMRCLISSEKDVKFLMKRGILSYYENKEKDIVELFQKLGNDVVAKDFYYLRLIEQVNRYKSKNTRVKWEKVRRGSPKTPLTFSVCGVAIILLVLTFVGVFFSVLSFFLHHA